MTLPEYLDRFVGACLEDGIKIARGKPPIQYKPGGALWRVVKSTVIAQSIEDLHTLYSIFPEQLQIHLKRQERNGTLHSSEDAQFVALDIDFYEERNTVLLYQLVNRGRRDGFAV